MQSGFWVIPKICKFIRANSWHHKLFHFHLPCWIWKVWKGRERITNIWISREQKQLFRWKKKTFFIAFEGLSFIEKIKIWQKKRMQAFITVLSDNGLYVVSKSSKWYTYYWALTIIDLPQLSWRYQPTDSHDVFETS